MVLQQMSQHSNQLYVLAFQVGRSVLLNKDYCLNTSSSSKKFRQGGNTWNLFDFDNLPGIISNVLCGYHNIWFHFQRSKPFRGSQDTT